MIAIRKSAEHKLETLDAVTCGSWLNVVDPGADDLARLEHELAIPAGLLGHSLDVDETARTEAVSKP